MTLGSSWPSSLSATHFQLHVTTTFCLARCFCGHEVQQLRELIWWEKQIVFPPPCSVFGWASRCASTAQDTSPGTEGSPEEPRSCTSHCPVETQASAEHLQQQPGVCTALSAFACRDWRSFNISVIHSAQMYSTSTFSIQHSRGWEHLKNGEGGCAQLNFSSQSLSSNIRHVTACALLCVLTWMIPEKLSQKIHPLALSSSFFKLKWK